MTFSIKTGRLVVRKPFATREEATCWAVENYSGGENWTVIKTPRKRRAEPLCNCGGQKGQVWRCPVHGNVSR